jgi:hypothetical protein
VLYVFVAQLPGHKGQYLVNFSEFSHPRVDDFEALRDPLDVAAIEHKLLFQDVHQVSAVEAAYSHDAEIELGL